MTLSYINKLLIFFLAFTAIPVSFVGFLLLIEADNMADDSKENIEELGSNVTDITTEALHNEGELYSKNKINESLNIVRDYLTERKRDCIVLTNITRTNESFLGYSQMNEVTYVKIAYLNSSGYEKIIIENNQITTNYTYVGDKSYFTAANSSSEGEVQIDNSELRYNYSKHVIRYSAKALDGVVIIELNMSDVAAVARTVDFGAGEDITLMTTAFTVLPKKSACYYCMFPELDESSMPTCSIEGVHPSILSIVGGIEVAEAVKIILG